MSDRKPYRVCAFYDTETTNLATMRSVDAFPILHQLGITHVTDLRDITPDNVESLVSVTMYRHTFEAVQALEDIPSQFPECVPVVCVHNLGFDMYSLSNWLLSRDVKVLAKSSAKPISFTLLDENGEPELVLWDTLGFSMRGLAKMGKDCGYDKLSGMWDYELVRTPDTPLTDSEISYAIHDVYALAAWFGWWCRRNSDVDQSKLGLNIVTKTGVVRNKRIAKFSNLKAPKLKNNVGRMWYFQNRKEVPKTNDELFTMHACTRGGFVFTSGKWASHVFDLSDDHTIAGFDATSQHPAQMCSKFYPERFEECAPDRLDRLARIVSYKTVRNVLDYWQCPFPTAFNAVFRFENLRLKKGSVFERDQIATLAYARLCKYRQLDNCDNESGEIFKEFLSSTDYKDTASDCVYRFGKVVSATVCTLFLTEIEYWIMCQVYEWDSCKALHGYATDHFVRPTDMCVLSVMDFYKGKNVFKDAMEEYFATGTVHVTDALKAYAPASLLDDMESGTASKDDVKLWYQQLKSDLNSLYGVECTNESRLDCVLSQYGISYSGTPGVENLPKNPKAWYQFGQRIVGWSRVAQIVAMQLIAPHTIGIVNGDTDSLKLYCKTESLPAIERVLDDMGACIDKAQKIVCARVKHQYPNHCSFMPGLGRYCLEFTAQRYCAAWNKAYLKCDENNEFDIVLAGLTVNRGDHSYVNFAKHLMSNGYTFEDVCNVLLGYNIVVDNSITGQNARKVPEFGMLHNLRVTDYKGRKSWVTEPQALALYPMRKAISDTTNRENAANLSSALDNNPNVNRRPLFIEWTKDPAIIDLDTGDYIYG